MSVAVMGAVFKVSLPPSEKVVALALADHAHDDGTEARPGLDSLAVKTSLSRRQVQRVVRLLVKRGVLTVQRPATNVQPVCYQFVLDRAGNLRMRGDNLASQLDDGDDIDEGLGVTPTDSGGDTGVTQIVSKPSYEPSLSSYDTEITLLCELLADLIEANGSKRPKVTEGWKTEMRKLRDIDGRSAKQIENMIRWCQADSFWRANILSVTKLRVKYDQMRLRANNGERSKADVDAEVSAAMSLMVLLFSQAREGPLNRPIPNRLVEHLLTLNTLTNYGRMSTEELRSILISAARERSYS